MTNREHIRSFVERELHIIDDLQRRSELEKLLVEPRMETREWGYGERDVRYPYWVVAESPSRELMLVYCEFGFGPGMPWGFLFTSEGSNPSLGMDAQWCWYLEEAFVRSGLWTGSLKPGKEEGYHKSPEERFGSRTGGIFDSPLQPKNAPS